MAAGRGDLFEQGLHAGRIATVPGRDVLDGSLMRGRGIEALVARCGARTGTRMLDDVPARPAEALDVRDPSPGQEEQDLLNGGNDSFDEFDARTMTAERHDDPFGLEIVGRRDRPIRMERDRVFRIGGTVCARGTLDDQIKSAVADRWREIPQLSHRVHPVCDTPGRLADVRTPVRRQCPIGAARSMPLGRPCDAIGRRALCLA
jgi:hypothetical protein